MASADMCEHDWPGSGCKECFPPKEQDRDALEPVEVTQADIDLANSLLAVAGKVGSEVRNAAAIDVARHRQSSNAASVGVAEKALKRADELEASAKRHPFNSSMPLYAARELREIASLSSPTAEPMGPYASDRDLIEAAVQASLDAGLAENGVHGVAAARHAARFVVESREYWRNIERANLADEVRQIKAAKQAPAPHAEVGMNLAAAFGPILKAAFPEHSAQHRHAACDTLAAAVVARASWFAVLTTPPTPEGQEYDGDALREALRLARPIVESDLADAIEHCDADWEGLSRTALEAIDAALSGDADEIKTARFGHHPEPAFDFCHEVECCENDAYDLRSSTADADRRKLLDRIDRALSFRVGGDEGCVSAKQSLRALESAILDGRCREYIDGVIAARALSATPPAQKGEGDV